MQAYFLFGIFLLCFSGAIPVSEQGYAPFEFAKQFTQDELLHNPQRQREFAELVFQFESKFHSDGVGINLTLATTFDGTAIDAATGIPTPGGLHAFSAASKEFLHLAMIALALDGNYLAQMFFENSKSEDQTTVDHLLDLLERKIGALDGFDAAYPGYGGFLPWFSVDKTKNSIMPNWDWHNRVPGLDNGEMMWGMYAVVSAIKNGPLMSNDRAIKVATRYENRLKYLTKWLKPMFFNTTTASYAAEVTMTDMYLPPESQHYVNKDLTYLLDDPYEGELLVVFCDLFCDWTGEEDLRERVWENKRAKLKAIRADFAQPPVMVQEGYWFSSHEVWKLWTLPYTDDLTARRVFANGEAVRTQFYAINKIPGIRASVTGIPGECHDEGYAGDNGIPALASQPVTCLDIVTPYGATPLFVFSEYQGYGYAWYANMLNGTKMQGPYGATESASLDGKAIAPVLTWDNKISPLVAMLGGTGPLVRRGLLHDQAYGRFFNRIETEYGRVFPNIYETTIQPVAPSTPLPYYGGFQQ